MPTSMTQALLLMKGDSDNIKSAWRQACRFIVSTLTEKQQPESCEILEPVVSANLKGYAICIEHPGCYSYCARCQVLSGTKTQRFIKR